MLTDRDRVMKIPKRGKGIYKDVMKSVDDTRMSKRENGGHAYSGDSKATRWDEGSQAHALFDVEGNVKGAKASTKPFVVNGLDTTPKDASNLETWWHVHPDTKVGGVQLGTSSPSPADKSFQLKLEKSKFTGNTFVIGLRKEKVTFYNGSKSLSTIKLSDFTKMARYAKPTCYKKNASNTNFKYNIIE